MKNNGEKVEEFWSEHDCSATEKNFYCFPPIRSHLSKLIFNEINATRRDWCEYWTIEKYLKDKIPFENTLSICCGFGEVERIISKLGVSKRITGIDIASGAITEAKKRAKEEGITNIDYKVVNLTEVELNDEEYDLIWSNGALHHIKELKKVIPMLYNSLRPGGYLISNEFVGPNYQRLSLRQQEIINAVKHIIPHDLRITSNNILQSRGLISNVINKIYRYIQKKPDYFGKIYHLTSLRYFMHTDPSECVNSINIIPTLNKYFDEMEVKYFGGSIMAYALDEKFYNNFDLCNINHRKFLEMIFKIEDTLIDIEEIKSDNAHIICKKLKL